MKVRHGFPARKSIPYGSLLLFLALLAAALPPVQGCGRGEEAQLMVPSVSSTLLTDKPLTVGDPIDIALIIYHEKGKELGYPKDERDFSPFTLRAMNMKEKKLRGGIARTLIVYTITIYQTGMYRLEPMPVAVGNTILKTEPLDIHILSVLPQDTGNPPLKDIVPPYRPRIRPLAAVIIGCAFAAAAVLSRFLLRLLKRKGRMQQALSLEEAGVDPYLFSLHELESLKREHAARRADVKEAYSRISFVLRFFLGRILRVNALQMTTSEFGRRIKRSKESPLQGFEIPTSRIIGILKKSDLVKFAKEKPAPKSVGDDIEETVRIVEEVHSSLAKAEQPAEGGADTVVKAEGEVKVSNGV